MDVLTAREGAIAVVLARKVLEQRIGNRMTPLPELSPVFGQKRGVFVTLTRGGELRGCRGFPSPVMPLGEAIREAALSAALHDPRFPQVTVSELPAIRVEVTVLTLPETLRADPPSRPAAVDVGKHGLIVRGCGSSGLLLPQVAVEYGWDSVTFLDHTCRKAGLPQGCWKEKQVEVLTFEGQIFHED